MTEDMIPPSDSLLGRSVSDVIDFDLVDELLLAPGLDFSDLLQPDASTSTSPFGSSGLLPDFDIGNGSPNPILHVNGNEDDAEKLMLPTDIGSVGNQMSVLKGHGAELITNREFQPPGPVVTMQERLMWALNYIKESQGDAEFLVQIWVPTTIGGRQVLTTCGQPFSLSSNCEKLMKYRSVSMNFHFSADENSNEALGLPGRVFVNKVPEWTPDVQYFTSYEYPRVCHAKFYDIRGTIGLPIFESGSRSCLGVVELVMTTQKINYNSELENICNALQAVDLRSSGFLSVPRTKVRDDSYQAALPEIQGVLRAVCGAHELPLAQTWVPCIQQAKRGSRHSDEKYEHCVSTVDPACYVRDPSMLGFHQSCSEHHLFKGEGVAGKAFLTNEPCFSSDITAYGKTQYSLSHHAKLFQLGAAVAIRLRSIYSGNADFVLEFFLPTDCKNDEEQKLMLNSLSATIRRSCRSLRVVTAKELEDEILSQTNRSFDPHVVPDEGIRENGEEPTSDSYVAFRSSPWLASIMEAQQKSPRAVVPASTPLEFNERETEGFSVTPGWDPSDLALPGTNIFSVFEKHEPGSLNLEKTAEKRYTKMEKTVALQDLRKHFAGSLKDAARNLGVCPTTLKRICRQHGITRWPSRKIKKVGHSLKKLQTVIDSVHGPEGAVQLSSIYDSFAKGAWPETDLKDSTSFSTLKQKEQLRPSITSRLQDGLFDSRISGSNSLSSSSCSQNSTSSHGCSSVLRQQSNSPQFIIKQETNVEENQASMPSKFLPSEEKPVPFSGTQILKFHGEQQTAEKLLAPQETRHDFLKVKAIYGEEKFIFRLQPNWGFQDLKQEIAKRFAIAHAASIDLKYLDDESEWVLLTCDADLQECIDVYKASGAHTIRISVHPAAQAMRGTLFGCPGLH